MPIRTRDPMKCDSCGEKLEAFRTCVVFEPNDVIMDEIASGTIHRFCSMECLKEWVNAI